MYGFGQFPDCLGPLPVQGVIRPEHEIVEESDNSIVGYRLLHAPAGSQDQEQQETRRNNPGRRAILASIARLPGRRSCIIRRLLINGSHAERIYPAILRKSFMWLW